MNLVLIETSGNQAFIFATNKLRENVGASELTSQVGTNFVLDAVCQCDGRVPDHPQDPSSYAEIGNTNPVEIILAVSGKALLLVNNQKQGRELVQQITLRALKEAPGLEVCGAVGNDEFDVNDETSDTLHQKIRDIHERLQKTRSRLTGAAARFPRLPIVAECASSGLPAARMPNCQDRLPDEEQTSPYSAQTFAKLRARDFWEERRDKTLQRHSSSAKLPAATTELEGLGYDWLGIVHADGNGLGKVFLDFNKRIQSESNGNPLSARDYITKLRAFSLALNDCTEKAFCESLGVLRPRQGFTPIVPLVLGGDDLTVVCDGRQALQFTKRFLDEFERATREHEGIRPIMPNGVTSCAGVAIVKPHFPFFAGYQLAEELLKSAKREKPCSAIDYHILYDASGPDLERIRRELTVDQGRTVLVARPYITSETGPPNRTWSKLADRIQAVRQTDDEGRRLLPTRMLHDLRESLFLGREAAESRLELVRNRYSELDRLLVNQRLYWNEGERYVTGLLDAIDTSEFWRAQL